MTRVAIEGPANRRIEDLRATLVRRSQARRGGKRFRESVPARVNDLLVSLPPGRYLPVIVDAFEAMRVNAPTGAVAPAWLGASLSFLRNCNREPPDNSFPLFPWPVWEQRRFPETEVTFRCAVGDLWEAVASQRAPVQCAALATKSSMGLAESLSPCADSTDLGGFVLEPAWSMLLEGWARAAAAAP